MSFLSGKGNEVYILGLITSIVILASTITYANEVLCIEQKLSSGDTFCEQTARHEALEQTWDLLNIVMDKREEKSQFQPTTDSSTKALYGNKTAETLYDTLTINWPRPKFIDRHFETAVASLDIDGKKDLKSCAKHGLLNDNQVIGTPEHQLQAVIYFSRANLKEIMTPNATLNSGYSLRLCTQLINLVLGNT
jgi:hypothetical protein